MTTPRQIIYPLFLLLLSWSHQAAATSVLPISLERMTAAADVIFHGRVTDNEVRRDPVSGNIATFTTFEITELVKGQTGATLTIKQIGGELPGSKMRQVIHGVPRFTKGREYIVFLPKPSTLGFASPIGLAQGKFEVHRLSDGTAITSRRAISEPRPAVSTTNGLPSGMQAQSSPSPEQGVRLDEFLKNIRQMVKE